MFRLIRVVIVAGVAAFGFIGCGPEVPPPGLADAALSQRQKQEFVHALKPSGSEVPVIAIVALNEGTEMTDLMLPYAVLKRANVAQVQLVAPRSGIVDLYPALQVDGAHALSDFDRAHPAGADYVIVPAMEPDNDAKVIAWLQGQKDRGARIISVCSGARVLANAGLLDGRQFTGHWYDRSTLLERSPGARYLPHQRYTIDHGVGTSTGVSASIPTVLALVEAIGGHDKAQAMADDLGVHAWGPEHDSSQFGLSFRRGADYLLNKATSLRDERFSVPARDGMDDVALVLAVDAWSRTGRARVQAVSADPEVKLRSGLTLVTQAAAPNAQPLPLSAELKPVEQLDQTLSEIAMRYGERRRDWVMQELEYPNGY